MFCAGRVHSYDLRLLTSCAISSRSCMVPATPKTRDRDVGKLFDCAHSSRMAKQC